MNKIFFLLFLFFLSSCYKYKENNELAIPPIAKSELKITTEKEEKTEKNKEKQPKKAYKITNK